jgi:hypothetical protein
LWWENLRERGHSEDIGIDGRMIFKRLLKNTMEVVDRIGLAQDRENILLL